MQRLAVAAALALSAWVLPSAAIACSCLCVGGRFVPQTGSTVPANLPAIVYEPASIDPTVTLDEVRFVRVGETADTDVAFSVLGGDDVVHVVPNEPLVPGARYEIEAAGCGGAVTTWFDVAEAAPLPTELGTLSASQLAGEIGVAESASCHAEVSAGFVDVEIVLAPSAVPWRDALLYSTRLDDLRWEPSGDSCARPAPGASWVGRGRDRIHTLCDGEVRHGTDPGAHTVAMRAEIAGATTSLVTPAQEIHVSCDDGGGCTIGRTRTTGAAVLLPIAALLLARRRRRLLGRPPT